MPFEDGPSHPVFSDWTRASSHNSSTSISDSPPRERVLYPLSSPASQASLGLHHQPYHPRPHTGDAIRPTYACASSPASPAAPPSADTFSYSASPSLASPTSPPPLQTARSITLDEAAAIAMPFPFLRRSASVTDLDVLPSSSAPTQPLFSSSSPLYSNGNGSASTNDLPDLTAQQLPPFLPPAARPQPTSQPMTRAGRGGAIGPKAGARLLASREAQRAMAKAEEAAAENGGTDFDIRDRVPYRADGGLSTVTASQTAPSEMTENVAPAGQDSSSGNRTRSGSTNSTSRNLRRVPVPTFGGADKTTKTRPSKAVRQEKSIHELTRRASQEEQEEDSDAARRRKASISKAGGAGLASPFVASPPKTNGNGALGGPLEVKKRRGPPVAGLNRAPTVEVDEHGVAVPNLFSTPARQRTVSAGSSASITKDAVLAQLGEAIKRERKKVEMYEREYRQGETELEEIEHNLDVLKEKFATTLEQQEQVIRNLEAEIEEVRSELEVAAQEYLALLSSPSPDALKPRPVVTAFDPSALTSSSSASLPTTPATAQQPHSQGKFSALAFRRGLSLKRRVDTHVAAYDTVASNVKVPKPPLPRHSTSPTKVDSVPLPRPRKLSRSRFGSSRPTTPVEQTQPQQPQVSSAPPAAAPAQHGSTTAGRTAAPPPAPVFRSLSSTVPSPLDAAPRPPTGKQRRPPPVSGVSRGKSLGGLGGLGGLFGGSSESIETDKVEKDATVAVLKKRSNSLTKTLRILFPSQAPKQQPARQVQDLSAPQQPNIQSWLRADGPTNGDGSHGSSTPA
ncbi:hypothetical protein JCM8097_001419 [Rhodosporidiobolus ruineniae]